MDRKTIALKSFQWKADKQGAFRARIATLNVVDHDGDVTLPGAFPVGKSIVISAYMHSSWNDKLPVGKGVIGANDNEAWVDGEFFTNTTHGMDTYLTVKALSEAGLGEWSYGYEPLSASTEKADLEPFPGAMRILKSMNVFEASPVLLGAGINTGTESIKRLKRVRQIAERVKAMSPDANTVATIAQLDVLSSLIVANADEMDDMIDNLMEQLGIPDPDEGLEPQVNDDGSADGNSVSQGQDNPAVNPEDSLMPLDMPKGLSYRQHAKHALASVQAFVSRSKSLADLRAKEGRTLSAANRDRLSTLMEALTAAASDIRDLLDSTDDGKALDAILFRELRESVLAK